MKSEKRDPDERLRMLVQSGWNRLPEPLEQRLLCIPDTQFIKRSELFNRVELILNAMLLCGFFVFALLYRSFWIPQLTRLGLDLSPGGIDLAQCLLQPLPLTAILAVVGLGIWWTAIGGQRSIRWTP